jgi:hypothetical protein
VDRLRSGSSRTELGTAKAALRKGETTPTTSLTLEVEVWDHIRIVTAQLSLLSDEGLLARRSISFDPFRIPRHFRPLTRNGGRVGGGMAVAEAAVATRDLFSPADALRLARASARARLISERLSPGGAPGGFVRSSDMAARIWSALGHGVTHDEILVQ